MNYFSMGKALLFFSLLSTTFLSAQEYKDTTLTVREHTCSCKYNLNAEDDSKVFDRSAKDAYYPGGEEALDKFVRKNIDKKLKGKHTVELRFQVDRNGDLGGFSLSNTAPAQKYEEVVRVLKLSGKWFPSLQSGFCVKSYVHLAFEL
jgi:hypothetical protein